MAFWMSSISNIYKVYYAINHQCQSILWVEKILIFIKKDPCRLSYDKLSCSFSVILKLKLFSDSVTRLWRFLTRRNFAFRFGNIIASVEFLLHMNSECGIYNVHTFIDSNWNYFECQKKPSSSNRNTLRKYFIFVLRSSGLNVRSSYCSRVRHFSICLFAVSKNRNIYWTNFKRKDCNDFVKSHLFPFQTHAHKPTHSFKIQMNRRTYSNNFF